MSQNYNKGNEGHNYYAASAQQTNIPQNMQAMNRNPQQGQLGVFPGIPVSMSGHELKQQLPGTGNFTMYRSHGMPQLQQGFPNSATAMLAVQGHMQSQRPSFIGPTGAVHSPFYIPQYQPAAAAAYGIPRSAAPGQIYRTAATTQPQQQFVYQQMPPNIYFQHATLHQRQMQAPIQTAQLPPAAPNGINNLPSEPIPMTTVIPNHPPPAQTPTQPPPPPIQQQPQQPAPPVEKKQSKALKVIDPNTGRNVMEDIQKAEKSIPAARNGDKAQVPTGISAPEPYIVNHQHQAPANQMGLPPQIKQMMFDSQHYGNLPIWTPPAPQTTPQPQTPVVSANIDGPQVIPKQQSKKIVKSMHPTPVPEEIAPVVVVAAASAAIIQNPIPLQAQTEEVKTIQPQEFIQIQKMHEMISSSNGGVQDEINFEQEDEVVSDEPERIVAEEIQIIEEIEELEIASDQSSEYIEEHLITQQQEDDLKEVINSNEPKEDIVIESTEDELIVNVSSPSCIQQEQQALRDPNYIKQTIDETDRNMAISHPTARRPEQVQNDFQRVMQKYDGKFASNALLPPGLAKETITQQQLNDQQNMNVIINTEIPIGTPTSSGGIIISPSDENEDYDEADKENVNNKKYSLELATRNVIEYHKEQWSPSNPSGKKFYTIEQLLELGKLVPPREKPSVKINPVIQNALIPSQQFRVDALVQKFHQHRTNYQTKRSSQQGNRPMHMSQKQTPMMQSQHKFDTIKISLSLHEEVRLKETANAWKPKHMQYDPSLSEEERELRRLTESFRCVLNKLTPDNFDVLLQEVKSYKITKNEHLFSCISLIFEKAIAEPNYSVTYAQMCKELSTICVHGASGNQKQQFKNSLINQCQIEFEQAHNIKSSKDRSDLLDKEADLVKKEELRERLEDEDYKMRKRAVGTIRFIGELYKIDLLTIRIMHNCVTLLMDPRTMDEESLECLCKLLTTVGKKMETEEENGLEKLFKTLHEIIGKKPNIKVSSRIKFMIQDVIDLRENRWHPRRNEQNPKTMGQIKNEVAIEQRNIQIMNQYHPGMGGNQMDGGRNRYDRRAGPHMNYNKHKLTFDSRKMDFSRLGNVEAETKLGHATFFQQWNTQGPNKFQSMDDTSEPPPGFHNHPHHHQHHQHHQQHQQQQHNMGPPSLPSSMNMMHPFGNNNKNKDSNYRSRGSNERRDYNHHDRFQGGGRDRDGRDNSVTKSGSLSRNMGPPGIPMMSSGPPRQHEQQHQQQQQQNSSASSSRLSYQSSSSGRGSVDSQSNLYTSNSTNSSSKRSSEKQIECEDVHEDERERLKKLFKGIFEDYQGSRDTEYAISDLQAIKRTRRWAALLEYAAELLDHKEVERNLLSQLFIIYVKDGSSTLTVGELLKIFSTLCEIGLDCIVDIPMVCKYLAEYLTPLFKEGILRLHDLMSIGESWIKNEKGHQLLAAVLHQLNAKFEFDMTRDLWCQSGLNWNQFMPHMKSNQLNDFIQNDTLLRALDKASSSNNSDSDKKQHNWNFIEKSIYEYCLREKDDNRIRQYIDEWLTKCDIDMDNDNFIRAFTAATINYCIVKEKSNYYINEDLFVIPKKLLKHYVHNRPTREMHALYAVQRVAHSLSYPQQLLQSIFAALYEQKIISIKGFLSWYHGDDMSYQKGVAITALRTFIITIYEGESEHSSSDEDN